MSRIVVEDIEFDVSVSLLASGDVELIFTRDTFRLRFVVPEDSARHLSVLILRALDLRD